MRFAVYAVMSWRRIGRPAWARGLQRYELNRNKSFAMAAFWGVKRKLRMAPALVARSSRARAGQQAPTPGQQGDWGPAGPPPDAQNGQVPRRICGAGSEYGARTRARSNQAEPGPGAAAISRPAAPSAPPASPGVGYGQPPRPAYQPGQNQPNGYNGNQARGPQAAPPAPPSGPVT